MLRILTCLFLSLWCCAHAMAQKHNVPPQAPFIEGIDSRSAKAYCDSTPIRNPEGIYLWPEHDASVLLRAIKSAPHSPATGYEIINIESSDLRLEPGQVVGYMYSTPSAAEYHIYIYTDISLNGLSKPAHRAAKYDPTQGSIQIKGKKLKLNFNPLALIPRMRSLLRYQTTDPASDLPDGFIRLYPSTLPSPGTSASPYPRYY